MAIGPGYKTFTFDGQNSGSYDVYITGEAVYNAPERTVEMITIPGRDGDLALDKGRFENIPVKYPAGMFGDDQSAFAAKVRAFRNMMASRIGYCRLEDEYNPDEYRLALYKSGLDVEPAPFQRAGEFDILFDCNPFRFLKSGEVAVAVANNGTLTNPTLFESKPLLAVEGTGKLTVNGKTIKIQNSVVGDETIINQKDFSGNQCVVDFSNVYIATGNQIEMDNVQFTFAIYNNNDTYLFTAQSVSNITGAVGYLPYAQSPDGTYVVVGCHADEDPTIYTYGTAATHTVGFDVSITNDNSDTATFHVDVTASYDGNKRIEIEAQIGYIPTGPFRLDSPVIQFIGHLGNSLVVHSTAATFGNPTYIDCDLGEAYAINSGVVSSLNRYIQLGAELPTLKPGSNTITFDNTITTLKITPRWREL